MDRIIKCQICDKYIGIAYLESVWEENDEKSYQLIHFQCTECISKRTPIELQRTKD